MLETIWERARQFDPERGSGLSWALAVARHQALDRLRKTRRAATREEAFDAVTLLSDRGSDPYQRTELRQLATRLANALATLPSSQRRMVVASFLLELSHREIAILTREPVGTVKGRIRIALRKLRRALAVTGA